MIRDGWFRPDSAAERVAYVELQHLARRRSSPDRNDDQSADSRQPAADRVLHRRTSRSRQRCSLGFQRDLLRASTVDDGSRAV